MMVTQEALKQHWDNIGEELQLGSAAEWTKWERGQARLDGVGVGGDTAHAKFSSADTHTDKREENGSSLNLWHICKLMSNLGV